jgi:DNA-binding PadR family transcriptional regulator
MNRMTTMNSLSTAADDLARGPRGRKRGHRHTGPFGPHRGGEHPRRGERPRRGSRDGSGGGFGGEFGRGPGADFGPGFGFGPRGGGHGPRRGRRGDVRKAILSLLAESPMNGYQVITAIAERSDGAWRPGPGSVYPALAALQDEGLVEPVESQASGGRRKALGLTEAGRAHAAEHQDELGRAWDEVTRPHRGFREVRDEVGSLAMALHQVVATGSEAQVEAARAAVADARKAVYRILAEEDPAGTE